MVPPLLSSLILIFSLAYAGLMVYLRRGWKMVSLPETSPLVEAATRVSIVVAARNEEAGIGQTIDCILSQRYPKDKWELIIVDDHSMDRTADIVAGYASPNVRLIRLNEKRALNSYKKAAIAKAIAAATGELIVATDADCQMGPDWLGSIVGLYESKRPYLISAPVVYFREKTLFERLQSLEFLYLIGLGASTIGNGKPTTCNGANLAYSRAIFQELGGFQGIDALASGDDELLLHKVAFKYPDKIAFCSSAEAVVYTHAKPDLKSFLVQRKRWASKSTHYADKSIVALGLMFWLYNFLLLLGMIMAVFGFLNWRFVLFMFAFKVFSEWVFIKPLTRFAKKTAFLSYLPLLSLLHIFYLIYIGISGNSGTYQWKGRSVR